jgi:hypothetical protein
MAKTYVGNGKEVKFQDGSSLIRLSFSKKDIETMLTFLNEKGWVNVNCGKRKETGKYGETHSLSIDEWKPEQKAAPAQQAAPINRADYLYDTSNEPEAPINPAQQTSTYTDTGARGNLDDFDNDVPF